MEDLVNQQVKDNCAEMHRRFDSARPFRHICIDNFLDESFAHSLLEQFPSFDVKLAINENGENDSVEPAILKKRLVYLHQRVRELESSSSWRVTRPIRVLKRALTGKG